MKYDVVVVGGGPAGAMASKYAARNGASTLLIEEHASIGSPVQCTGLISTAALRECEIEMESFALNKMKGAYVYAPDGTELEVKGKDVMAYVIDRKMFDRSLIEQSLDSGVDILMRTRFTGMEKNRVSVVSNGERKEIHAGMVIGADGLQSAVCRSSGLPGCKKFLSGMQIEAPYAPENPEYVEIFTGQDVAPGFFGWAVPFNGMARIGLARTPGDKPVSHYLEKLLEHSVVTSRYRGSRTEHVVGGIPLGYPDKTAKDNVMLVGDAAGQVKPTSGGGIYMGAICAKIAGEVAAKATRNEAHVDEYEKRWRNAAGRELSIGMMIHKSLGKLGDNDLNEFISYLNQPEIRNAITEYGDIDHPSVLFRKLLSGSDKKQLIRLFGVVFRTLF